MLLNEPLVTTLRINDQEVKPVQPVFLNDVLTQYRGLPKNKPGLVDWLVDEQLFKVVPLAKQIVKRKQSD
jgi:hypothetical protein